MDLLTLKRKLSPAQYAAFAEKVGTSVGYLEQIAYGHRRPSPALAKKMAAADRRLTLEDLRPDIFGDPS